MTTAADRLLQLAGTTGTAAALLLAICTGATAGEVLVEYSGLADGTAAEHLLIDRQRKWGGGYGFLPEKPRRKRDDDDDLLMCFMLQ